MKAMLIRVKDIVEPSQGEASQALVKLVLIFSFEMFELGSHEGVEQG